MLTENRNMINILLACIIIALSVYIGLELNTVSKNIDQLLGKPDITKETPSVTLGAYRPVNENTVSNTQNSEIGLVSVKTPQLLEFEEQEELRKMNLTRQV